MNKKSAIFIVSSGKEAEEALRLSESKTNSEFIATSLQAELYLESENKGYVNPSYKLKGLNGKKSIDDYYYSNFKLSYSWYKNPHYQYIREKLGFYLAELDRSLDFASKVFKTYKPKRVIVASWNRLEKLPLIDVHLEPLGITLIAKSKKIPMHTLLVKEENTSNLSGKFGRLIQAIRSINKQSVKGNFDVLVVAHPSKLANMLSFVSDLRNHNLSTLYLTYELTRKDKNKIDSFLDKYYEKERLVGKKEVSKAHNVIKQLLKSREWNHFVHPKYARKPEILFFMQDKIHNMVQNEMENMLRDHYLAERIISESKPKIVLTLTDPDTKALTFINAARKMGITTVSLQHGVDFDLIPYSKPVSDYYLVWSKLSRKRKLTNSKSSSGEYIDTKKILIAKSPFHSIVKERGKQKVGMKPQLLLLLTNHLVDKTIWNYYLKKLFIQLKTIESQYKIIVRLHPHQTLEEFQAIRTSLCHFAFANEEELHKVIDSSDVILFENTTAGLDTMLFSKPTIFFNPYTGGDFFNLGKNKVALTVLSEQDLEKVIPFIKNRRLWNQYAKNGYNFARSYTGLDSKNRLVKIIRNLVNSD